MQLEHTRAVTALVASQYRDRWMLVERAEQRLEKARARAYGIHAPSTDREPVRDHGPRDRIGRRASALADAERRLEDARKWVDLFSAMDKKYPPSEACPEGMTVALVYGSGYSLAETARTMGVHILTARRRRDAWMIEAAILAAELGLLERKGGDKH